MFSTWLRGVAQLVLEFISKGEAVKLIEEIKVYKGKIKINRTAEKY